MPRSPSVRDFRAWEISDSTLPHPGTLLRGVIKWSPLEKEINSIAGIVRAIKSRFSQWKCFSPSIVFEHDSDLTHSLYLTGCRGQDVPIVVCRSYECVNSHGQRNFTDVIKLRTVFELVHWWVPRCWHLVWGRSLDPWPPLLSPPIMLCFLPTMMWAAFPLASSSACPISLEANQSQIVVLN